MDQDLRTLSEHLKSTPVLGGVHAAQILVFYVVFCVFLFAYFYFSNGAVCLLSTYDVVSLVYFASQNMIIYVRF